MNCLKENYSIKSPRSSVG